MNEAREAEIRNALAKATVGREDLDPAHDGWILAAWDLLAELDATRQERNWRISTARSEIMRYGLNVLPTLRDTPDAQDVVKQALHDIETPLLADTVVPAADDTKAA